MSVAKSGLAEAAQREADMVDVDADLMEMFTDVAVRYTW